MGIKIGDIDVANEVVDLNFQMRRTQLILQLVLDSNPQNLNLLTPDRLQQIETEALTFVRNKFPNMGVDRRQP